MQMPVNIRPATPADAGPLAQLAERTFRDTFARDNAAADMDAYVRQSLTLDRVRAELDDPDSRFFVALAGGSGQMGGYAKLRRGPVDPSVSGPSPIELERLYVDQPALGHGVGAALMRRCLHEAHRAGCETVWLGVWERNARAIAFYERWGFRIVGDHIFQLGSDAQRDLIMERPALTSAEALEQIVATVTPRLLALGDEDAVRSRHVGAWTPTQILGHLVDSASNNHGRFVRAALQDDLVFPGYDQEGWVRVQRYEDAAWADLVGLWGAFNRQIARVVAALPDDALTRPRPRHNLDQIAWKPVPAAEPATLAYFIHDYIGHMENHVRQVLPDYVPLTIDRA
jgi:ribosomal protein S18 acetylase RimI-like enzyme